MKSSLYIVVKNIIYDSDYIFYFYIKHIKYYICMYVI